MKYPLPVIVLAEEPDVASVRRPRRPKPFILGQHVTRPATAEQRADILVRDYREELGGWVCPYCCDLLVDVRDVHVDHIVARKGKWRRGGNAPDNLVACCVPCNLSKGNKPVESWLSSRAT